MRIPSLLIAIAFVVAGCGSGQKQSDNQSEQEQETNATEASQTDGETSEEEESDAMEMRFPQVSPKSTVSQMIGINKVAVTYSRPSVDDPETGEKRKIWGELVPYGERWRTGANARTRITFSHDVKIQGQKLEAGTYSMFSIPGKDQWTLIFNNQLKGSALSAYDKSKDALRVKAQPKEGPYHEMMTFQFRDVTDNSGILELAWKKTRVPFNIDTETDKQLMAMMEEKVQKAGDDDWEVYNQCAAYLAEEQMHMDKAKEWVAQSRAIKKHWRNTWTKAQVMRADGAMEKAISLTKKALEMGKDDMSGGYKDYMKDELEKMKQEAQA